MKSVTSWGVAAGGRKRWRLPRRSELKANRRETAVRVDADQHDDHRDHERGDGRDDRPELLIENEMPDLYRRRSQTNPITCTLWCARS